ncbi:hypothetical protein CK203_051015 [Vitis vinifera]|uniref:RNase H type-1 domain-containing protein n=1 Tax=Vitis vinifera TaxID=29760 RepID=A0A438GQ04_VITVI|nr:hypothetical protein CK203_051015 [Vitis vinifera]
MGNQRRSIPLPFAKEQKPVYYVSRALADVETRFNWANATMGHRIERIWNRIPTQIIQKRPSNGRLRARIFTKTRPAPQSVPNWGTSGAGHPAGILRVYNEAEYEAILSGLDLALALSVSKLRIYSDSQLVVRHVQKEYEAKDSRMARYLAKVRSTLQQFTEWTIEKIKRADNGRADAWRYSCFPPIREAILLPIHVQANPSVAENSTCNSIEADQADDQEWTHDIAEYSGQELYPKILNERTKSGCKLPVSPDWGAPVQAILHRALSSLSWAFRGPVCVS